jgi:catechol 2,3-dioxygenase-like lactoylglutathione lyase family enzyme
LTEQISGAFKARFPYLGHNLGEIVNDVSKPFQYTIPGMQLKIAQITLLVQDYDEAIAFYVNKLGFRLIEDTPLSDDKRWVLVAPPDGSECCLLLAKAANEQQASYIGNQTGGRVFLFLFTDDFWQSYNQMVARGVSFTRQPIEEDYGRVAVFGDLYGNLWDLIQPKARQ